MTRGRGGTSPDRAFVGTVAVVNSVQDFWKQEFQQRRGTYTNAPAVFYSGRVGTACGTATSAVGPFYGMSH